MFIGAAHEEGGKVQACPDSSLTISLGSLWRGSLRFPLDSWQLLHEAHRLGGRWAGSCTVGLPHAPTLNIYPVAASDRMLLQDSKAYCQEMGFPELIKGTLSFLQDQPPFSSVPNNTERKGTWNTSRLMKTVFPSTLGFYTYQAG